MNEKMRELERRSRAAFDESVEAQDAATRSRLARARAGALDPLRHRSVAGPALWIPAGAAAAALVAAMLWQREEAPLATSRIEATAGALEDLDLMAAGEDFDLLGEEPGFYAWADEQIVDGVG
jgi:type VI protein secretion system component VasF